MVQHRFLVILAHLTLVRLALLIAVTGSQEQQQQQQQQQTNFNNVNSLDFSASSLLRSNESAQPLPAPPATVATTRSPGRNRSLLRDESSASLLDPGLLAGLPGLLERVLSSWNSKSNRPRSADNLTRTHTKRASSSLSGETSNLLSVTNQLVKLARSQASADLSSWLTPMASWTHEAPELTAAGFKSDWFWMVVPAVIVLGAGVILIPMAAAWLVSHAMSQSAFSVTAAGRRRRKRDLLGALEPAAPYMEQLYKMLDLHQILDDPAVLVEKLSRLHSALDSVQASMMAPMSSPKPAKSH